MSCVSNQHLCLINSVTQLWAHSKTLVASAKMMGVKIEVNTFCVQVMKFHEITV